jgi:hypothetical protein
MADIFEEKFWFIKVEALRIDEFQLWVQNCLAVAHFEEAVDDEDEFLAIGGKASVSFHTFVTDFQTEFLAHQHLFKNCSCPRCSSL